MKRVEYTHRVYLGDFKAIDTERTEFCDKTQQINGLTYLFRGGYVLKVIETSFIKSITSV